MIRNIVFDMGNVLILFDPNRFMDREGITDPEDRRLLMNELFLSVEWAQMDCGTLTEETAEPQILQRIPERLHAQTRRLLTAWADPRETIGGMEALVERLRNQGYRLFLLSNASVAQHSYWPRYTVSRLMEGKLISCDVHTVKPNPDIYRLFTDRFELKPEECLFVDDAPANVAAAILCGWQGIVFHGSAEELERKMKLLGVRL
ncbi:MAG: HAD family phosphatase [Clostridia bacterium]|nr:HAD family phosphatase [Clostridia bacterium]